MFRSRSILSMLFTIAAVATLHAAGGHHTGNALWITVREADGDVTTIAITEEIARAVMEADKDHDCIHQGKDGLVTREMIGAVLDGREESVDVHADDGGSATVFMKELTLPGNGGTGSLVMESWKEGKRVMHLALPVMELNIGDDGASEGSAEFSLDLRNLAPFLATSGGGVYIDNRRDGTEFWLYVD